MGPELLAGQDIRWRFFAAVSYTDMLVFRTRVLVVSLKLKIGLKAVEIPQTGPTISTKMVSTCQVRFPGSDKGTYSLTP